MGEIKDKIEDKIENIVYKKAKEEIEATARGYFKSLVDKVFSFFGWEETQAQKIERISKEIQEKKDVLLDDSVVGVIELFTMNYVNAIGTTLGVDIADDSEIEPEVDSEKGVVKKDSKKENTSKKEKDSVKKKPKKVKNSKKEK